jgi:glycosyltransferase involved in cell wall biosynthesis
LKEKYGIQWIADLRDPWTDIYYYKKMNHTYLAKYLDAKYEKNILEQSDKIIVVSQYIKKLFLQKSDLINPDKIYVIPNGFDEEDFSGNHHSVKKEQILIAYNGTLSDDYPIQPFIAAFKEVLMENKFLPSFIQFTGSVSENIKQYIVDNIPNNCLFNEHVPHKKSVEILMQSDISLLLIPDVANNEGILTGKLFEYLAAENPIICIGPKHGNAADIIEECKSGKTFEKSEITSIAAYLKQLILKVNSNQSIKINNHLNWKYSRKNLSETMAKIVRT